MRILSFLIFLTLFDSCKLPEKQFDLQLEKSSLLNDLPSASGIAVDDDSAYIIGDDAVSLYKLSLQTYQARKTLLPGYAPGLYRIPKPIKHDFESAVIGTIQGARYLLAFGSGTLSPHRDSLLIVSLGKGEDIRTISLTEFYQYLLGNDMDRKDLNIEGATIAGNNLYFFNRGNNDVIKVNWPDFFNYINTKDTPPPDIDNFIVSLPVNSGVQAGFSGACTLNDSTLLFTASIENTKNWTQDGEILGSYIGILDIANPQPRLDTALLVKKQGKMLKTKLESLDIVSTAGKKIIIESVSDNDDGTSVLYRFRLERR